MGSHPDPRIGGRWAAGLGAARKDCDNDQAAAATRARRAMIGGGVRIGGVVRCRRLDLRDWGADKLLGARDVGLAAGAGQQPVVADAMEALWQNVEQEAPDKLVDAKRHDAVPRLPVAAGGLFSERSTRATLCDRAA